MDPDGKRAAIMAAGEALFAANGYSGTTMADIARTAGVAVGSVYRLFPDKPSLLAALHAAMEDKFIAAMTAGWTATPAHRDKFGPMIDALMAEAERTRETMALYAMTREMLGATDYVPGARMVAAIAAQYASGIAAGAFHDHPPVIAASIAQGMVGGAMQAWMMDPTRAQKDAVTRDLKALFNRAFLKA